MVTVDRNRRRCDFRILRPHQMPACTALIGTRRRHFRRFTGGLLGGWLLSGRFFGGRFFLAVDLDLFFGNRAVGVGDIIRNGLGSGTRLAETPDKRLDSNGIWFISERVRVLVRRSAAPSAPSAATAAKR